MAILQRLDNAGCGCDALRVADLKGSGPWELPVIDRIAAGEPRSRLVCLRAMTAADGLILLLPDVRSVPKGDLLEFIRFSKN